MQKPTRNYAFIDAQNLNLGIQALGWKLDYRKFRTYLKEKYAVEKAYMFLGFLKQHRRLYDTLQNAGFVLIFKSVVIDSTGRAKGNVDVDLTLQVMIDLEEFDKAVIITSDGDFGPLVRHLYELDKLEVVLSPYRKYCSTLLRKEAKGRMFYLDAMRDKLEFVPK
jgi:uncharacterized LabA/DUF88 family protein